MKKRGNVVGKLFDNKLVVVLLLLVFFPVGLFALWKGNQFRPLTKKIITALCFIPVILALIPENNTPATDQAKPYTIIDRADAGFVGRDRYFIHITSTEATNRDQFAHTAIKAAIAIQKETRSDVVAVMLEPSVGSIGQGLPYAIVRYAPDGRGLSGEDDWTWEAEAAEKPLTKMEIAISELWWGNRDNFQVNGMTDEPAIMKWIASKLGIESSQVNLPFISRKAYNF
jgi:hypothetical protein